MPTNKRIELEALNARILVLLADELDNYKLMILRLLACNRQQIRLNYNVV